MNRRAGILLAAGDSRRFGRDKQLLLFAGETLLRRAARALVAVAAPAVALLPEARLDLAAELDGLALAAIHHPETRRGMGRSLALGAAALGARGVDSGSVLVALVDQPHVDAEVLGALAAAAEAAHGWAVCDYGAGAWGPPICLPAAALPELYRLDGDRGARELVASRWDLVARFECRAGGVDIDTPDDYARLAAGDPA